MCGWSCKTFITSVHDHLLHVLGYYSCVKLNNIYSWQRASGLNNKMHLFKGKFSESNNVYVAWVKMFNCAHYGRVESDSVSNWGLRLVFTSDIKP